MRTIPITVTKDVPGAVVFAFDDGPRSFVVLAVVDEAGTILWALHPASTQEPNAVSGGTFFSLRIPDAATGLAHSSSTSDEGLMNQFPLVARVTYGATPVGYEAAVPAAALLPSKTYSVIILRDAEYAAADFRV